MFRARWVCLFNFGAPKVSDFNGKPTAYVDDFEAAQTAIDISTPLSWTCPAPLLILGRKEMAIWPTTTVQAFLNWYTIDPIFTVRNALME